MCHSLPQNHVREVQDQGLWQGQGLLRILLQVWTHTAWHCRTTKSIIVATVPWPCGDLTRMQAQVCPYAQTQNQAWMCACTTACPSTHPPAGTCMHAYVHRTQLCNDKKVCPEWKRKVCGDVVTCTYRYGLYSCGLYCYCLNSYGLYSYGLCIHHGRQKGSGRLADVCIYMSFNKCGSVCRQCRRSAQKSWTARRATTTTRSAARSRRCPSSTEKGKEEERRRCPSATLARVWHLIADMRCAAAIVVIVVIVIAAAVAAVATAVAAGAVSAPFPPLNILKSKPKALSDRHG